MHKIITVNHIDDKIIKEWKDLWKRAENANVFNSYEWFLTSIEIEAIKEYELYLCYEDERLAAILPLQKYKCFGVNVWGTINKEHLIDTAFLIEKYDKKIFKIFFGDLLKNKNIFLQKVDSDAVKLLHNLFPELFFSLISVNPIMDLTGDPFAKASSSTIKQVKKIIRKNADQLRFEVFAEEFEKHMKTMFALHEQSSKKVRSMDIFADGENKTYYMTLTKNFPQAILLCFLYFNNKPIAYQYGFLCGNSFVGDQIAYHNEYAKLRPGKLIVYYLVEYLKKHGIHMLDQGGGISNYKMEFAQDYRLLYNIYYSPNKNIMLWWKIINKARRIKQTFFQKKFTRDHEFLFKTLQEANRS